MSNLIIAPGIVTVEEHSPVVIPLVLSHYMVAMERHSVIHLGECCFPVLPEQP